MSNKYVDDCIKIQAKLKQIIESSLHNNNYNILFPSLNAICRLKYQYNQQYVDEEVENAVVRLAQQLRFDNENQKEGDQNTIVFYDSFGLDTRGLACIYLKALVKTGKRVVYITNKEAQGKLPTIQAVLENSGGIMEYVDRTKDYYSTLQEIGNLFKKYNPAVSFEYNEPWDIEGIVVFTALTHCTRYKINLTDHAYWCGVNSFDYILEFRDYGAYITKTYRQVEQTKIVKLPFYPLIDKNIAFDGFPFDHQNKKVIFSGGSLYKTIDESGLYYTIVDKMLQSEDDIFFLYAGSGDDSKLKIIIDKYPGRVYHCNERKDLFEVLKHSFLYLSTYPMIGGLMSQYAAVAGCLPLTLRHNDDGNGVLINEDELQITYDTVEALMTDFVKLVKDDAYKKEKEERLQKSVIDETVFFHELNNAINDQTTAFNIKWEEIDTTEFLLDYYNRFDQKLLNSFVGFRNKALIWYFPLNFITKFVMSCKRKLKRV